MGLNITVDYVNATKGWRIGEEPMHDTGCDTLGELFRTLQRCYGRCVSRSYVTVGGAAHPVGWTFQKRQRYDDCRDTFLLETWVALHAAPDTVKRTVHYAKLDGGTLDVGGAS